MFTRIILILMMLLCKKKQRAGSWLLLLSFLFLIPSQGLGQKNTKSKPFRFYQSSLNLDVGSLAGNLSYSVSGEKYEGANQIRTNGYFPFHLRLSWEADHFLIGKRPQIIGAYVGYQTSPLLEDTLLSSRSVIGHFAGYDGMEFHGILIGGLAGTYINVRSLRLSLVGRVGYEAITERKYITKKNQPAIFNLVSKYENIHGLNLGAALAATLGRVGFKGEFSTTTYRTRIGTETVLGITLERINVGMFFLLIQNKKPLPY